MRRSTKAGVANKGISNNFGESYHHNSARDVTGTINHSSSGICSNFFDTNHLLRLMESISVCIAQNEPILLVGETGVGKMVIIQRLASMSGTHLVVQNMSLQIDSTDLLGGYRPVEIGQSARKMYKMFMEMFVSTFHGTKIPNSWTA